MRILVTLLLIGLPALAQAPLRLMTYNIRYDNPADGQDAWAHRREMVASMPRIHRVDLLCIQEGLAHQVAFLKERLGWEALGVGRDDGREAGEQVAILHDPRRLKRLRGGHFWLSPTPERPGLGWDAACPRMATWATFRGREGQRFLVCNTHLDHQGAQAQRESARLLRARLKALARGLPILLAGDFNVEEDSEPIRIVLQGGFEDTRAQSETPPHGPRRTYSGFSVRDAMAEGRLDYVFVTPGVRVLGHATLGDFTETLRFPSDHLPVLADLVMPVATQRR